MLKVRALGQNPDRQNPNRHDPARDVTWTGPNLDNTQSGQTQTGQGHNPDWDTTQTEHNPDKDATRTLTHSVLTNRDTEKRS